ncbi:hypothetical protein Psta_1319 [Pirellula staleyi DSM 6068]|uniref:Uncharacterized protein n=1 Tax=Pirellula staleyi (strain ATCC 27377 / DSM 6068 / ICPB 4128) TaxID=530564 RepID=D2QWC1_PIRSD|nr:hypothetical protein [Pirellula staleyi]ADB15996.1 hypothetical protein Psta_1319 [Pirellula staleyi DSM 6068]
MNFHLRQPTWMARGVQVLALLLTLLTTLSPQQAQADTGGVLTLPVVGVKAKTGIRLSLDNRGVDATGYRPYRIKLATLNGLPLTEDRQFRVVISPSYWSGNGTGTQVEQIIEFPEGSLFVEQEVLVPQVSLAYAGSISTYEDGAKCSDLSRDHFNFPRTNNWHWTEATPSVLVIDSDVPPASVRETLVMQFRSSGQRDADRTFELPDVRTLTNLTPDVNARSIIINIDENHRASKLELLAQMSESSRGRFIPPAEVSERWLALSTYDMAIISLPDLKILEAKHPAAFVALRQWVSTGSNLLVYDAGADFDQLPELEKMLKLPAISQQERKDDAEEFPGWREPDSAGNIPESELVKFRNSYTQGGMAMPIPAGGMPGMATPGPMIVPPPTQVITALQKKYGDPPFLLREHGLGSIVVLRKAEAFPGEESLWMYLLGTLGDDQTTWVGRQGMSLHRENGDYWNFLIEGVGSAPVISFALFISLFAIMIGPVNYWFLGQIKRTYLLLITVPLGASVVTLLLFCYALVTDGIGVRSRIRSVTVLCPESGEFSSFSRHAYYAAIAPSKGLVFPSDSAVFPLVNYPVGNFSSGSGSSQVLQGEVQQLRAGFLQSRTLAQFMVTHAGKTECKLIAKREKSGKMLVTNQLQTDLSELVVRDNDGNFYFTKTLAAGESQSIDSMGPTQVRGELVVMGRTHAPMFPNAFSSKQNESLLTYLFPDAMFLGRGRVSWSNTDTMYSRPQQATGMLERRISRVYEPVEQVLKPGEFYAFGDRPPLVPLGVSYAYEQQGSHFLTGRFSEK